MAAKGARGLSEAMKGLSLASHTCREAASARIPAATTFVRSMATEAPLPIITTNTSSSPPTSHWRPAPTVPVTIFNFPSYEPQRLEAWSSKHLNLPLRRDILHLAVVYEGDNTRQGTASSKTRYEVHGSHKKMRPQKGMGRARVGTRQSPIQRGGGKTFGPKPRDFGTKITRKVYDLAWRTALSYRYRRGELVVCQDGMELPFPDEFQAMLQSSTMREAGAELEAGFRAKWVKQVLDTNEWGRKAGRSTFITSSRRVNLFEALGLVPNWGRALDVGDVDVKDLLETGRIVVEHDALKHMIESHQSDIIPNFYVTNASLPNRAVSGEVLVE
ncbi:ribosomal protein L4/L1 family protein [Xylaria bambusicola]|uniref:ribosomal protein L4/L1 family protein n=1 Tax=Xylaria bambusicola TaxID=326684 RepID=UPI0020083AD0|nr:ribosomal protein L4/L1 family protein [Xylaria bambusicola]KAI0517638.1 ribosomal protein L4/L1 family protein [Xylaria bambusicola]